jgi:hypothetical protein
VHCRATAGRLLCCKPLLQRCISAAGRMCKRFHRVLIVSCIAASDSALVCRAQPTANRKVMVWNRSEAQAMRRHVLLGCLEQLKDRSSLPWARTAAHLALQSAKEHRACFCNAHQDRVQALVTYLDKAKANVNKVQHPCTRIFFLLSLVDVLPESCLFKAHIFVFR